MANALAAVDAGVRHVQATINGYGERAGNANIVSLLANLALKTPYQVAGADRLSELSGLSHAVAEIANLAPDDHQPYVGRSAFAHKGGVHGAAQVKTPRAYQHVDPEVVGNRGRLVVSELGGKANARSRAAELGVELADAGDTAGAIRHFEECLRLNPRSVAALNNLGNALRSTGRLEEAVARHREALRHEAPWPDAGPTAAAG